jgi:hypothetical protein
VTVAGGSHVIHSTHGRFVGNVHFQVKPRMVKDRLPLAHGFITVPLTPDFSQPVNINLSDVVDAPLHHLQRPNV